MGDTHASAKPGPTASVLGAGNSNLSVAARTVL